MAPTTTTTTTKIRRRRFLAVATTCASLTAAITPQHVDARDDDAFVPCFDETDHPPLCRQSYNATTQGSIPQDLNDDNGDDSDVNTLCYDLEYYLEVSNITDVTTHLDLLAHISADDASCQLYRRVYSACWWCKPNLTFGYCTFESCDAPAVLQLDAAAIEATCREMNALYKEDIWPSTIEFCDRVEKAKHACPVYCDLPYLGAETVKQKRALVWMSRTGAILSFLGASYILWDSLSKAKHRTTVYHQLLIGVACFDIVTAVAWSLGTTPIPVEGSNGIEGTRGNEMTCKAQGYFVQLGYTSVFYNVSLALYYLLVIVYNWRERALKKIRIYLHGIPLLVGFGLAFGGIKIYDWIEYGCHLLPPPGGDLWTVLVFSIIPICFSVASITVSMFVVYISVRRKSRASRKWRLGFGKSSGLEQRVFWQALFYTFSFYVTWPILLGVYAASVDAKKDSYAFSIIVAFVAPLQGFNNFLVYVRPKVLNWSRLEKGSSTASRIFHRTNRPSQLSSITQQQITSSEGYVDPSVMIARGDQAADPVARPKNATTSKEKLGTIEETGDDTSRQKNKNSPPNEKPAVDPSGKMETSNLAADSKNRLTEIIEPSREAVVEDKITLQYEHSKSGVSHHLEAERDEKVKPSESCNMHFL